MRRMDDALYSTILLHSSSDGENSETETLHTSIETMSNNGAIDAEQITTAGDVMVRERNAFTCGLRSNEESRTVIKVCTY